MLTSYFTKVFITLDVSTLDRLTLITSEDTTHITFWPKWQIDIRLISYVLFLILAETKAQSKRFIPPETRLVKLKFPSLPHSHSSSSYHKDDLPWAWCPHPVSATRRLRTKSSWILWNGCRGTRPRCAAAIRTERTGPGRTWRGWRPCKRRACSSRRWSPRDSGKRTILTVRCSVPARRERTRGHKNSE